VGWKKLNREVQYKLRERRDQVKTTSIACDQEDVQLQNVIYEQKHLSKEADTCMKFKSRHHEFTNLASLNDVVKSSGLSSDALEELNSNPHKQTMARLELELKQRQDMKNQLDTERASLASRKDKILEKDGKLKKVDNQLLKLLEVTGPICDTFGIETDKIIAVNSQAAHLKSTKLSYLFKQISQQVNDKDFKCLKSPKVESSKSADEDWAFSLNSSIEGKLTDFCMKFKHEDPVDTTSPVQVCCNQPYIAACLFQEAEKYGFVDGESPEEADKSSYATYNWCQEMCGFAVAGNPSGGLSPPQLLLREIDAALSLNTSSNIQLGDFLLKQKFPPISSDMVKKFKGVKPFAVIERFEEMSYEKYKSLSLSSQVIKEGLARPSQKYFVGRLTRSDISTNTRQALNFAVAIPHSVSVGCIFSVEQNSKFTSGNKLALRLIETEINNNVKFTDNILADQMFLLAILYDVLVEIEVVQEAGEENVGGLDDDNDSDMNNSLTRTKNFSNDLANTAFLTGVPQYDPFTGIFSDW